MAKTSQLSGSVGINARYEKCGEGDDKKLTPAVHGPDSHRNFYLRIRHFCPLVSPTPSKRRAIYAESANPRPEVRNSATKKGPLAKPPQESRPRGRERDERSFFPLYIHPASPFVRVQRPAPAPDSIPTSAIFHWEHDCEPLADWRRRCHRGPTSLRTAAPLTGERETSGGET